MKDVKPFLKWPGGKRRLLPTISSRLKAGALSSLFIEPFCGAGAVTLGLAPKRAWMNDLNSELILTYRAVQNDVELVLEELRTLESSSMNSEGYYAVRDQERREDFEDFSTPYRAARFIFLNKTGFNGLQRVNSSGWSNVAWGKNPHALLVDEPNLHAASERLKTVRLTCSNWRSVVEEAPEGSFLYLDPPYASEKKDGFVGYQKEGFTHADQTDLRDALLAAEERGVDWLYSNAATQSVLDLFASHADRTSFVDVTRTISVKGATRGKAGEVLISSYPLSEARAAGLFPNLP